MKIFRLVIPVMLALAVHVQAQFAYYNSIYPDLTLNGQTAGPCYPLTDNNFAGQAYGAMDASGNTGALQFSTQNNLATGVGDKPILPGDPCSMFFNGTSSSISGGPTTASGVNPAVGITIEAIVRPTRAAGFGTHQVIISKGSTGYELVIDSSTGSAELLFNSVSIVKGATALAPSTGTNNIQGYYVCAYSSVAGAGIYVGRIGVDTAPFSDASAAGSAPPVVATALCIGARANASLWFQGSLSWINIYNYALPPSRMIAHYTAAITLAQAVSYGGNSTCFTSLLDGTPNWANIRFAGDSIPAAWLANLLGAARPNQVAGFGSCANGTIAGQLISTNFGQAATVTVDTNYNSRQQNGGSTLSSGVTVGGTSIPIASIGLPAIGGAGEIGIYFNVIINPGGGDQETVVVASTWNGASTTIPLVGTLANNHSLGETVTWSRPSGQTAYWRAQNHETILFTGQVWPVISSNLTNRIWELDLNATPPPNESQATAQTLFGSAPLKARLYYLAHPTGPQALDVIATGLSSSSTTVTLNCFAATPTVSFIDVPVLPTQTAWSSANGHRLIVRMQAQTTTATTVFVPLAVRWITPTQTAGIKIIGECTGGFTPNDFTDPGECSVANDQAYMTAEGINYQIIQLGMNGAVTNGVTTLTSQYVSIAQQPGAGARSLFVGYYALGYSPGSPYYINYAMRQAVTQLNAAGYPSAWIDFSARYGNAPYNDANILNTADHEHPLTTNSVGTIALSQAFWGLVREGYVASKASPGFFKVGGGVHTNGSDFGLLPLFPLLRRKKVAA